MAAITSSMADEIRGLMEQGFEAGWVSELRIGDIFADHKGFITSLMDDAPRKICVVERILGDRGHRNSVVSMIVTDEDGVQRHLTYGGSLDIYIWRGGKK